MGQAHRSLFLNIFYFPTYLLIDFVGYSFEWAKHIKTKVTWIHSNVLYFPTYFLVIISSHNVERIEIIQTKVAQRTGSNLGGNHLHKFVTFC